MNVQALSLAFLATVAVGGAAWVFIYPLLSGEKQAESRRASVARPEPAAKRQNEKTQRSRREQVESSLKDLDVHGGAALSYAFGAASAASSAAARRFSSP